MVDCWGLVASNCTAVVAPMVCIKTSQHAGWLVGQFICSSVGRRCHRASRPRGRACIPPGRWTSLPRWTWSGRHPRRRQGCLSPRRPQTYLSSPAIPDSSSSPDPRWNTSRTCSITLHDSNEQNSCSAHIDLLTSTSISDELWPWHNTDPFNGPFSGTTRVGRYQKGKTNLDFAEARDSEWQWHQLGHMQVCTSLQTNNHASTSPLNFFTGRMPFLPPNQQRQSTEGKCDTNTCKT